MLSLLNELQDELSDRWLVCSEGNLLPESEGYKNDDIILSDVGDWLKEMFLLQEKVIQDPSLYHLH